MTKQNRYLLQVNLANKFKFKKTFTTYNAMKQYIKARDFYFTHCDYNTYDLAINIK